MTGYFFSIERVGFALLLTLLAGLATGIGALIALYSRVKDMRFLSVSMGFSAGVMIFVSMFELFGSAQRLLVVPFGSKTGVFVDVAAFFGGIFLSALVDKLIPGRINPHELAAIQPGENAKTKRLGMVTVAAIVLHNFPEGMATFVSCAQPLHVALPVVAAVALHNIPEGIAISMPIFEASKNRRTALGYALLSGLGEPLGALLLYFVIRPYISGTVLGVLFAVVGGIMVYISLDELLPGAEVYGEHHLAIYGLVGGMAVIALSLWAFQ